MSKKLLAESWTSNHCDCCGNFRECVWVRKGSNQHFRACEYCLFETFMFPSKSHIVDSFIEEYRPSIKVDIDLINSLYQQIRMKEHCLKLLYKDYEYEHSERCRLETELSLKEKNNE